MPLAADLLICLRFFSRLPVPPTDREIALGRAGLVEAAAMVPVAGVLIGLCPALTLALSIGLRVSSSIAALLSIAVAVLVTGALHEDALADCADGFGGGATKDRKLEILRDSRIGAYGTVALVLSLMLRATALADLTERGLGLSMAALVAVAAMSRTASLLPLALLRPARADGSGAAAAGPSARNLAMAILLAIVASASTLLCGAGLARLVTAVATAAILALTMCAIAWRQIGGQTGDVAGATQQIVEIGTLLVFAAGP